MAFSLPLLAGNFLQFFYGIVDSMIVGRILGAKVLAAISTTMPLLFLMTAFLIGMGVATNILAAQAYGAKNLELVKKILVNSWLTSIGIGLAVSAAGIIFHEQILGLINTPPDIKPQAGLFFTIICGGLVFQFTYNWFSGLLRGLGDAQTPLYILLCSTVLNIILVPLFIIGLHLGIAGAALGTVLANLLGLAWGYWYATRKYALLNVKAWVFVLDWPIVKKILVIGLPSSLQMMVGSLAGTFIMSLVNRFGSDVTAAYGIGLQADQIAFLPAMTVSIVVSTMVGQNLGVERYERVKEILYRASALAAGIGCLLCLFTFCFPSAIASLFTTNTIVLGYAARYFRIVCFSYITFSLMFSLQGVVRGAGDTVMMLLFSIISLVLFRVPLAYYLSQHTILKEQGIWLAILTSTLAGLGLSYLYYINGRWKRIKVLTALR